jgi:hypothetical protein
MPEPVPEIGWSTRGYDQLADRLQQEIEQRRDEDRLILMGKNFHFTGMLNWILRDRQIPPLVALERKNANQFGVWYRDGMYDGWNAIYVDHRPHPKRAWLLRMAFDQVEKLPPVRAEEDGIFLREFDLYYCRGFRGPI